MAAYAALVSLMNIIHDLQHHPFPPISLDIHLVDSITKHITFFQEFLESYNPPTSADEEEVADPLEMRIADAAYAAEDAIETHIVDCHIVDCIQHQINYGNGSKITHLMNCFRAQKKLKNSIDEKLKSINLCRDSLHGVIEEMKSIDKVLVVNVDEEKKKMKMAVVVHDQVALKNVPSSVTRNGTMVGSDGALQEILDKLVGGRPDHLLVIPIVGMGGIGKTFLAKTIYANPRVKDRFDICAWATISQQYNTREILCELVSQTTNTKKEQLSGKSEDVLGYELHKYLFYRRFLIVMDDMWSIDAWEKIQHYFPDKSNCSRVVVTTRLSQLSSQLNDYSFPMRFLDEASSWDLFSRTVFGEKSCPPVLKKIAQKIVANCRGLPLSIVVVGGLLKNLDDTRASWESIRDNLTSVVNMENDKHCLRLLKLSYNHLPVYLKPCFLYMGVFEEDHKIRVSMIVRLWVSEGFLNPRNGESLETTGRGLLQDLIDRNLILIDQLGCTGSIKSFKIHDLLRDLCLKEGQKYGFYHVIGKCNTPPQGITKLQFIIPWNMRIMPNTHSIPPRRNLGLLRTLYAYKFGFFKEKSYYNSLMFRYVSLRHLAIISWAPGIEARGISSFLRSVSLLWNLHTLIVSCPYKVTLLADIWKMPQLRHIDFIEYCVTLPDPPSVVREDDVLIMENLHTVRGVLNFKCSEGVVKRIPNIKHLKFRYQYGLLGTDNNDEHCVGNIKSLCGLESLSISLLKVRESNIYMHKLTFPHSLKKLSLVMDYDFEWDDGMLEKIGSLPRLEKLRLWYGRFGKGTWETFEGQFPCLKYLVLNLCYGLERWTAAEEGSSILPRLEQLDLFDLGELEKIPSELGNISTLKRIWMAGCGEGAVTSAKEIVDEQVESQGEQLTFHVRVDIVGKESHLQSFSGPNFGVRMCDELRMCCSISYKY